MAADGASHCRRARQSEPNAVRSGLLLLCIEQAVRTLLSYIVTVIYDIGCPRFFFKLKKIVFDTKNFKTSNCKKKQLRASRIVSYSLQIYQKIFKLNTCTSNRIIL